MSIQYTADQLQRKFQDAPEGTAFARIAEVLRNEGRHEEAVSLCQAGLQRNPGYLSGHLVLGKCYAELERTDEARDQFETALRLDPRCLSAMHWLARIMDRMQWRDAATAYYRSILEIEPWDEEAQAHVAQAGPAPSMHADAAPAAFAPEAPPFAPTEVPAGEPSKVEEFDLNAVADFLPAESSPSDLAGALEEASLEEALGAPSHGVDRSVPPAAAADVAEPTPMDILPARDENPPETGEPAPISGDDVGERLDSLFGTGDDKPATAAAPSVEALEAAGSAILPAETGESPVFSGAAPTGEAAPPESPEERVSGEDVEQRLDELFSLADSTGTHAVLHAPDAEETAAPTGDDIASAFDRLAETAPAESAAGTREFPDMAAEAAPDESDHAVAEPADAEAAPEVVVTGQDVADKLEALFGSEPQTKAAEEPRPPASGSASWAAARPAEDDDASGTATSDRFAPGSGLMSTESMLPRGIGAADEQSTAPVVTGEDIEDRLDDLFNIGDEGARSGAALRAPEPTVAEPEAASPEDGAPRSADFDQAGEGYSGSRAGLPAFADPNGFDAGDDRTVMMPAMEENAADWLARQNEAPGIGREGMGNETMLLPADAPMDLSQDPVSILDPDSGPSGGAAFPAGTDTVGMEMVDGSDIAERLDQIFAPEDAAPGSPVSDLPAAAARAAAEEAIFNGEAKPPEEAIREAGDPGSALSLEADEMPFDEVVLFAQDPESALPASEPGFGDPPTAETVVSGEDVTARLSEIFPEPLTGAETTGQPIAEGDGPEVFPAAATWTPAVPMSEEDSATETVVDAAGSKVMPWETFSAAPAPGARPAGEESLDAPPSTGPEAEPVLAREAGSPSLPPLLDEEEAPLEDEEENALQSAAGANVATVTLAEIYFQQGLREQALQIYRQLLEREPGNESVRKRIQEIEASKPETGPGPGTDPRRPRPGLKVPKRKK